MGFTSAGRLMLPGPARRRLGENVLADRLARFRELLFPRPDRTEGGPAGQLSDFEDMHWFPVPPVCPE